MILGSLRPDGTMGFGMSPEAQSIMLDFAASRLIRPRLCEDKTGSLRVFPEYRGMDSPATDMSNEYAKTHDGLMAPQDSREGWRVIDPSKLTYAQSVKALDAIKQALCSASELLGRTILNASGTGDDEPMLPLVKIAAIALYSGDLNDVLWPIASSIYEDPDAQGQSDTRISDTVSRMLSLDTLTRQHLQCNNDDVSERDKQAFTSAIFHSKTPPQVHQYLQQTRTRDMKRLEESVRSDFTDALNIGGLSCGPPPDEELVRALTRHLRGTKHPGSASDPAATSPSDTVPSRTAPDSRQSKEPDYSGSVGQSIPSITTTSTPKDPTGEAYSEPRQSDQSNGKPTASGLADRKLNPVWLQSKGGQTARSKVRRIDAHLTSLTPVTDDPITVSDEVTRECATQSESGTKPFAPSAQSTVGQQGNSAPFNSHEVREMLQGMRGNAIAAYIMSEAPVDT